MPALLIVHSTVTKPELFKEYATASEHSLQLYGGEFLFGGNVSDVLEGSHDKSRAVIFQFSSAEQARAWYQSDEYQAVRHLREDTGELNFIVVDSF
ncbi:MAG: DUF1330 domain-containing protein [Pseudomonadales bacterium]